MPLPTTAQLQAMFAPIFGLIDSAGEDVVVIQVETGNLPVYHNPIKARPVAMTTEDLISQTFAKQGDFFLICRANPFPVARRLEQRDRVRFRGRDFAIINDDSNQYSIGGICYARKLHVRG